MYSISIHRFLRSLSSLFAGAICLSVSLNGWADSVDSKPTPSRKSAYDHIQTGDFHQSIIDYETLLAAGDNTPEIHFNLGISYFKTNRYSSAHRSFEEARVLSIDNPQFQAKTEYSIGVTLFEQARAFSSIEPERSISYLEQAVIAFENAIQLSTTQYSQAETNREITYQVLNTFLKEQSTENSSEQSSEDTDDPTGGGPEPDPSAPEDSDEPTGNSNNSDSSSSPTQDSNKQPQSPDEDPKSSDQIPGAPSRQQIGVHEALLILDALENEEKRITLSELLQTEEQKGEPKTEPNW